MDTKALKDKILQLAIQGKLVEQDPNDEPASVLLEKIKEEKEKLIKEKKIKKQKPLPKITDEEKPFEIPENWEWCRLGDISKVISKGTTPKGGKDAYKDKGVYFLRVENLTKNYNIDLLNVKLVDIGVHEGQLQRSIGEENDLLISIAGTLGKVAVLKKEHLPCNMNQAICFVRIFYERVNVDYLKYIISSLNMQKSMTFRTKTTAQPNLTLEIITNLIIPLPPLSEQKRIVEKVDKLFELIDALEEDKEELLKVIELTRNKVLQLAIQGKLVEQNPNDEPASILLEKIKEEKENLIKEKKIKKQKPLPKITDEEKPFEIPESWEWVRLGDIGTIVGGGTPKTSIKEYWVDGTIPWLTPADLSNYNNKYISKGRRCITELGLKESSAQLMPKGTVLFSSRAPIGYTVIAKNDISTNQGFKSCVPFIIDMNEYLYYYLNYSAKLINERASGTTFKEISGAKVKNLILPLPPLSEQKRIVEKVDHIMGLCDELEEQIKREEYEQ